jgi:hypothetical protein
MKVKTQLKPCLNSIGAVCPCDNLDGEVNYDQGEIKEIHCNNREGYPVIEK